jgi:hypothetical protein
METFDTLVPEIFGFLIENLHNYQSAIAHIFPDLLSGSRTVG